MTGNDLIIYRVYYHTPWALLWTDGVPLHM